MDRMEATAAKLGKEYGEGALMRLSDKGLDVEASPSGNIALDIALGIGGYPKGRIIEAFGPESSGKTTLALHAIAEVQKNGGIGCFVDAEHALDPVYAEAIGVNIDELWVNQPSSAEEALEITLDVISEGKADIVVVDSVAALTPRAEIAGDMGDSHVGLQARLMSQAMRKLNAVVQETGTVLFFINQIREKIGVMFGSPETTPGGRALKFYSSVRLDIRRKEPIKDGTEIIGNRTHIKVVKNKVAPPFKIAEVDIMYGEGISQEASILDLAVEYEVAKKSGAWYYDHHGEQIGQGKEKSKQMLREDPVRTQELYNLVMEKIRG